MYKYLFNYMYIYIYIFVCFISIQLYIYIHTYIYIYIYICIYTNIVVGVSPSVVVARLCVRRLERCRASSVVVVRRTSSSVVFRFILHEIYLIYIYIYSLQCILLYNRCNILNNINIWRRADCLRK